MMQTLEMNGNPHCIHFLPIHFSTLNYLFFLCIFVAVVLSCSFEMPPTAHFILASIFMLFCFFYTVSLVIIIILYTFKNTFCMSRANGKWRRKKILKKQKTDIWNAKKLSHQYTYCIFFSELLVMRHVPNKQRKQSVTEIIITSLLLFYWKFRQYNKNFPSFFTTASRLTSCLVFLLLPFLPIQRGAFQ